MTPAELSAADRWAELEKMREKATAGPWFEWSEGRTDCDGEGRRQFGVEPDGTITDGPILMTGDDEQAQADAALIVAAVNALPALIATVREQAATIARAQALAERAERHGYALDPDDVSAALDTTEAGTDGDR